MALHNFSSNIMTVLTLMLSTKMCFAGFVTSRPTARFQPRVQVWVWVRTVQQPVASVL